MWNLGSSVAKVRNRDRFFNQYIYLSLWFWVFVLIFFFSLTSQSMFGQFSSTMKRVWVQEVSQKKISVSVGLCCSVIAGFCTGGMWI